MIIEDRCSKRCPQLPRDKSIPRQNTEANSEPGLPFYEHARRIRRDSTHLMSSFWPGLWHVDDKHCSNWGKGTCGTQFQKDSSYDTYSQRADPWLQVLVHAIFSTTKPISLSTWHTPTPCPSTPKSLSNIPSPVDVSLTTLHPQCYWELGTQGY